MTALGEMIVNLTDPQAAAAEVSQLNMRLSRSERIPESVASDIDEIARSISETDYRHWDATAPELAPLALTAVLSATQAVAHRDEDWAREELRLALGQLSYALARIAEGDPISPERSPKEIARWLAESAEVPQREIAELLGVPLRTFQRWLSEREPTAPDGDEATRLRVLAALFTQLRHVFTPAGTLRWLTIPNGHLEGRAPQELLADGEALPKLLGIARGLRDQPAA